MKHSYSEELEIIKKGNLLTDYLTTILLYSELFEMVLKSNDSVVTSVLEMNDTLENTIKYIHANKMSKVTPQQFMHIYNNQLLKSKINYKTVKKDIEIFNNNINKYTTKYNYIELLNKSNYSVNDKVNIMVTFNNFKNDVLSKINNTFSLDKYLDDKLVVFIKSKQTDINTYLKEETRDFLMNKLYSNEFNSSNIVNKIKKNVVSKLSDSEKILFLSKDIDRMLELNKKTNVKLNKIDYFKACFTLKIKNIKLKRKGIDFSNTYKYSY